MLVLIIISQFLIAGLLVWQLTRKHTDRWPEVLNRMQAVEKNQDRAERLVREETARNREELGHNLKTFNESLLNRMTDVSTFQKNQLDSFSQQLTSLTRMNEEKLEKVRTVVQTQLHSLQEDNAKKLDRMREVVDEKLHATLEKRLGDSFRIVSERLEKVHQGLGEMQTLASGVGDLKKVLTNVKTRGTWGEVQLGNLLEQVLTPDQYDCNIPTKRGSRDPVEFAVKLPGHNDGIVYLPIDAKFPVEDYERLQDAQEAGNVEEVEAAAKAIENRLKLEAKNIQSKYIDPPHTTDFGILFLPTEGLFAEVLRRPGLGDLLRRNFRVIVTGPTTIAALLNSLQMGFRTLAIEKRASEVWTLLGRVKTEFGKFGDILEKTHKKLQEASNTIESAARKSRTIERNLRTVEALPAGSEEVPNLEGQIDAVS